MQTMKQTLSQGMTGKVIIIGILGILLLLPTSMTESLLLERQERQQQLRTEVSQQWVNNCFSRRLTCVSPTLFTIRIAMAYAVTIASSAFCMFCLSILR